MESSFKRLWRRKKSKDRGDTSKTPSSAGYARNDSITTGGRNSSLTSRHLEKLHGNEYLKVAQGDLSKDGKRIQPILIGISRPSDFVSRPETAVSLNTAVQRAADTARTSQDKHRQPKSSGHAHRRSLSGRSADVFKVAGKIAGYKSRFNEEIAERNLEYIKLTQEADSSVVLGPAYIPTSRYQEEVADRNASGLYGSKTSLEYDRATSLTSRSTRTAPTSAASPRYQPTREQAHTITRSSFEQPAYHSRQYSSKSRDGGQHLPSILQERTSEEGSYNGDSRWTEQPVTKLAQTYQSSNNNQADSLATKPLPELPRPGVKSSFPIGDVSQEARQISSSHSQHGSITVPPPPTRHPGRIIGSQNGGRDFHSPPPFKVVEQPRSPPSLTSSASPKGVGSTSERRIMDFTNEDDFSETSSMYGYSQYSPVLEQADTGRFGRTSRRRQSSAHSKPTTTDIDPIPEISQESIQRYMNSLPDRRVQKDRTEKPAAIAFSMINTMASLPPQGDVPVHKSVPVMAPVERTVTQEEVPVVQENGISSSQEEQQIAKVRDTPVREQSMSRVQRAAAALEARSASQSPKSFLNSNGETVKRRSFVAAKDEPSTAVEKAISALEPVSSVNSDKSTKVAPESLAKPAEAKREEVAQPVQALVTPRRQAAPKPVEHNKTPNIYDSPDSLHSSDYTTPGESFGIRTRDFAVTPAKTVQTPRKKSNPQLLQRTATENAYKAGAEARSTGAKSEQKAPIKTETKKSVKTQAKRSASAVYVPPKSEFDEEAFARKRAEAKAALIRLQQSLQEDFIDLPGPIPPKHRSRVAEEEDGSPVAPSSIVYPQSILSQPIERPTFTRSQTQDAPKPSQSFRSNVISTDRLPSATSTYGRSGGPSSRKAAPASLQNVEAAAMPINPATLPPSLQHLLFSTSAQQPRSPGEISLSSFPVPSSRPGSQHEHTANMSRPLGYAHMRRNSNRSMTSVASQFSIPFHMIPDRSSSYRDAVIEED